MANQINARFLLKYDSYQNWTDLNPVLLAGEVAIATIPAVEGNTTQPVTGNTLPQVLIKVGDGTSHYTTLPFASALAADVHPWAKESQTEFETRVGNLVKNLSYTKAEVYNKTEIDAFLALYYKKTEVDAITGALADLNTTNKSSLVGAINEALQAVEVGGTDSVVSVIKEETPTEGSQATYKVTQGGNVVGVKIEIPVGYDETALAGRVGAIEADYVKAADIANFETKENVKKVADDLDAYKTTNDEALAGVKATAEAAQTAEQVGAAIDAKIEALDLENTYDAKGAANTVNEALEAYKTSNDAAVGAKANQSDLDETDATVAALKARVEAFLDNTGAATEAIDTLQELLTYIETHDDVEISGIIADIQALENKMVGIDGTVADYVTGAINALAIGDYAKAADLTALAARVKAIEDAPYATTANVATAKQEAIDAAAADAETKANAAQAAAEAKAATAQAAAEAAQRTADDYATAHAEDYTNAKIDELVQGANDSAGAAQTTANEAKTAAGTNATAITALQEKDTALETEIGKKANDADLKEIAKTGSIYDVTEGANVSTGTDGVEYLIFYAGTASTII